MAYWLLKTEPDCYAWADLGATRRPTWDGVTNALALKHIRSMKKGDLALIYHTGDERRGRRRRARSTSDPYPDPKAGDEKLAVVDLKPKKKLTQPGDARRHQGRPGLRRLGPAAHRPAQRRAGAGRRCGTGSWNLPRDATAKTDARTCAE